VPSFASRYVNPVAQHIVMSQPNNQSALNRFLRCLMAPSDLRQLMELCRKHNRKVLRPLQPVSSSSNSSSNKSDVLSSRLASILELYMSSIIWMGRTRTKRPPWSTPFSLLRYLEDSTTTLWLFSSRAVSPPSNKLDLSQTSGL
jgi:hypothetical protein